MNDHDDIFEAQLRSLKPAEPSRRLKQAIAEDLHPRRQTWRKLRLISGIAAAIVVATAVWVATRPQTPAPPSPPMVHTPPPQVETQRFTSPAAEVSAWHYRWAARQSPEHLVHLLDEQAANAPGIAGATPTIDQLLESQS